MTPELAYKLIDPSLTKLSDKLEQAREIYIQSNGDAIGFPYSSGDISFQGFLEEAELTEREQDMIYISTFFHQAYTTLHITMRKFKEMPSPFDHEVLEKVFNTMKKYNLQHCLLKDVPENEFMVY